MSTVLYKPIAVNPQAYFVFPGLYELIPNTVDYIENCTYTGILEIHIGNQLVKQYENTSSIDLSEFVNAQIRISLVNEVGSVLLGEWIIDQLGVAIPEDIRKSMVVWYDVARQSATNESMQANPVLKDFSGHGRDATCYNFAWAGRSGIGGFAYGSGYWRKTYPEGNRGYVYIFSSAYPSTENRPEFSFTVKGITDLYNQDNTQFLSLKAYYQHSDTSEILIEHKITQDGHYSFRTDNIENFTFWSLGKSGFGNDRTKLIPFDIEVIEDMMYPNALVSDGVDDYAMVKRLPMLNKEDGYTVIVKRTHIDNNLNQYTLIAKNSTNYNTDGAFKFEHLTGGYNCSTDSFGISTRLDFSSNNTVYQQTRSYNGEKRLNAGSFEDSNFMVIFNDGGYQPKLHACTALYSLILFNRDLTPEEIAWVKTNLIEQ